MTAEDWSVLVALPEEMARSFEALLHQQARTDRTHRRRVILDADLVTRGSNYDHDPAIGVGVTAVEELADRIAARFSHGCGGGRRRNHYPENTC